MKIGVIGTRGFPEIQGGIETHCMELYTRIASLGDNEIPDQYMTRGLFESPATLNDTWGYKSFDNRWKTADQVITLKNHLNERGINYLLNVGPDYLGRIPAPAQDILREVGRRL